MPDKPTVPTDEEISKLLNKFWDDFDQEKHPRLLDLIIGIRDRTREATLGEALTCVESDYDVSHLIHWLRSRCRAAEEARK